ncbi:MAG: glycosyltransferase family 4 protein [Anaerolineales bacterium]|nr:glycosyltransferase family 4 protein [Anaerolineales bacterium]HJO33277.1 glycosyltransferase family 4 protein [Anaerolineales bacterium]
MARVLMLTLVYGPDTVSTANMMTDIAQGLQAAGHEVTVLTSVPHYNPSAQVRADARFTASWWRPVTESREYGVRVLRVFMPLKRHKVWARGFDYLLFQFLTTWLGLFLVKRPDVVFVTSPPITLGLSGILLSRLRGGAFIYDVRELWPDVPVRMGLFRNPLLVRFVYALEAFVYRQAAAISMIARSFQDTLVKRGVPRDKLHFTPNFVDVDFIHPTRRENDFSREHGLNGAFVVLYAGNVGLTQGLEILIDVAADLSPDERVQFLVVGDGAGRAGLERAVARSGLANFRMLPFQSPLRVNEMYAAADVCVAPLLRGFSYDTVPSKIYTAMAAGRAVVACAETDTETAALLCEAAAGTCVTPESRPALTEAIRALRVDPETATELGAAGRKWIENHYSRAVVVRAYDCMVRDVCTARN